DEPAPDGRRRDGVPDADRALHVRLVEPRAGDRRVRRRRVAVRAPARRGAAEGEVRAQMNGSQDAGARSSTMSEGTHDEAARRLEKLWRRAFARAVPGHETRGALRSAAGDGPRSVGFPAGAAMRMPRAALRRVGSAALGAMLLVSVVVHGPHVARADEPVAAERFIVVAANPHATRAGYEIIEAGGSAVDAAIAVQAVLSLVEPQSSGIGGGAFMLHFDAPDEAGEPAEIIAYEGRETAPAAATPDMFLGENGNPLPFMRAAFGGLPVGVPGGMRMLELAHERHGRLPWAELFAPAIELAEQGFEISPRRYLLLDQFKRFETSDAFRAHYYDEDGEPHPTGYRLVNPEYAESLRLIAEEGADAMYTGALADAIVREVRENSIGPGRLAAEDLARYAAHASEPLCSPYREWRVCGPQLPSSGGVTVQQILGMLARFD